MKTLEEIRCGLVFELPGGTVRPPVRFRLDERDWKRIIDMIELNGWVIMPREPTDQMIEASMAAYYSVDKRIAGAEFMASKLYAALIEARPRHDAPRPRDKNGFGQGGFGT